MSPDATGALRGRSSTCDPRGLARFQPQQTPRGGHTVTGLTTRSRPAMLVNPKVVERGCLLPSNTWPPASVGAENLKRKIFAEAKLLVQAHSWFANCHTKVGSILQGEGLFADKAGRGPGSESIWGFTSSSVCGNSSSDPSRSLARC